MEKQKRKGVIGVDRSGSRGDYPVVVVSVYSDRVVNFYNAIEEVKNRLKLRGFIKGKDFKSGSYEKVIGIIKRNGIEFNAFIIDQKIYTRTEDKIRWMKNWEMKLEAYLWSNSVFSIINGLKDLPDKIFYERTYTGSGIDVFDNVFKSLIKDKLDISSVLIGGKREPQIIIADWIAHFFYKDRKLNNLFKENVYKLVDKEANKIVNEIQFTPSSRHNRSPRNDWNIKYKNKNYINLSVEEITKEEKDEESGSQKKNPEFSSETTKESTHKYILFEKTKVFYTIIYPKLVLFPKSEKFTLRQRIEELILDSLKLLIKQNYKTNDFERKQLMLEYIANIELLIYLIQLSAIFKYISLDVKSNLEKLLKELVAIGTARYKNLRNLEKNLKIKNETI